MGNIEAALAVIDLPGGASIKMEALDPTTSLPVAGVKVSNWTMSAIDLSDTGAEVIVPDPQPNNPAYLAGLET